MRLYRRLQFGTLLDLSVLDTRQFRSKQACDGDVGDRLRGGARSGADDSRRRRRSSGCSSSSASAKATWTVLGQQVPTFARDNQRAAPERPLLDGQVGRLRRRRGSGSTRG